VGKKTHSTKIREDGDRWEGGKKREENHLGETKKIEKGQSDMDFKPVRGKTTDTVGEGGNYKQKKKTKRNVS